MCYDGYKETHREVADMPRRKIELPGDGGASLVELGSGKALEKNALPRICERVRFYRERAGLEQKAFAARLGVTPNAVSNWECGRSRPDVNLLPAICAALGITLYELYGSTAPEELSARERKLLGGYRALSLGKRYAVEKMVALMQELQLAEEQPELRQLLFFERGLAAGAADPTEFEQDARPVYLYDAPELRHADYLFPVNGDSMEPDFHSGDLVLVEKLSNGALLRSGEIGAFIVGNETYIKEYREDGLHSRNPKYGVLRFGDEAVYLIGRVLGTVSPEALASQADVERYCALHGLEV